MNFFLSDTALLELKSVLEQARSVASNDLPEFLGRLEEARVTATARLSAPSVAVPQADELLTVEQAAARLNLSTAYLYRHSDQLPFTVRQGRKLLFSTAGITKYIQTKTKG